MPERRWVIVIAFIIAALLAACSSSNDRLTPSVSPESQAKADACRFTSSGLVPAWQEDGKAGLRAVGALWCPDVPQISRISATLEAKYDDGYSDRVWQRWDRDEVWLVKGVTDPSVRTNRVSVSTPCQIFNEVEEWRVTVTASVTFGETVPFKKVVSTFPPCGGKPQQPSPARTAPTETPAASPETQAAACRLSASDPALALVRPYFDENFPEPGLVAGGALRCPATPQASKLLVHLEGQYDVERWSKDWIEVASDSSWLTENHSWLRENVGTVTAKCSRVLSSESFKKWRVRVTGSAIFDGKEFAFKDVIRSIGSPCPN